MRVRALKTVCFIEKLFIPGTTDIGIVRGECVATAIACYTFCSQ